MEISNFNFIASTFDSLDLDTLKSMTDEIIDLYGFPCIYTRYTGPDMINHPLYKDRLTSTYNVDNLVNTFETRVFIESKHFVPQLMGAGYSLNVETPITAFMHFDDNAKVEDLVTLLYKHEAQRYTFQINSATNWKNICWNCTLSVLVKDDIKGVEFEDPQPLPVVTKKERRRKRI